MCAPAGRRKGGVHGMWLASSQDPPLAHAVGRVADWSVATE